MQSTAVYGPDEDRGQRAAEQVTAGARGDREVEHLDGEDERGDQPGHGRGPVVELALAPRRQTATPAAATAPADEGHGRVEEAIGYVHGEALRSRVRTSLLQDIVLHLHIGGISARFLRKAVPRVVICRTTVLEPPLARGRVRAHAPQHGPPATATPARRGDASRASVSIRNLRGRTAQLELQIGVPDAGRVAAHRRAGPRTRRRAARPPARPARCPSRRSRQTSRPTAEPPGTTPDDRDLAVDDQPPPERPARPVDPAPGPAPSIR